MTTEDDFQATLDAHPDDWQTRLVFADWLQERGDERAEGYRALGLARLHQIQAEPDLTVWSWFRFGKYPDRTAWYGAAILDDDLLKLLEGGTQVRAAGTAISSTFLGAWRDYNTRREAEDAAARAFALLPVERRAKLLQQTAVTA